MPLAPKRAPVEGDSHASLLTLLDAVASEFGYQLAYVEFGRLYGLCDYPTRRIRSPSGWRPTPACRCWVQERAHAQVGRDPGLAKQQKEVVAEAVVPAPVAMKLASRTALNVSDRR